jgi:hypothetical protein
MATGINKGRLFVTPMDAIRSIVKNSLLKLRNEVSTAAKPHQIKSPQAILYLVLIWIPNMLNGQ